MTGFTLIELMLVTTIIGILAAIAIPAYQDYTSRTRISEALPTAAAVETQIVQYYDRWGRLPADNAAAGLPQPNAIRGRNFDAIEVLGGVVHIHYSDRNLAANTGKELYIYPAINSANPTGALTWLCNEKNPVPGFVRQGDAKLHSDVASRMLPTECRSEN
jgi:type IV pilus assembly protein PilA